VIAVGIGNGVAVSELNAIATDPDADNVFTTDFSDISSIVDNIREASCTGSYFDL